MIKKDLNGRIVYPDGYRKNMYVKLRDKGTMMHVSEEQYQEFPHRYEILKGIEQIYLEGLLAQKHNKYKRIAAAKGIEYPIFIQQNGDLAKLELEKELRDAEIAVQQSVQPQFEEINITSPYDQTTEAPAPAPEAEVSNFQIGEPLTVSSLAVPEMTAEGLLNHKIDKGEVVKKASWYSYDGKNYRRGDILRTLGEQLDK